MIVATAGHVDHGKTRLIQRLTGVDTDRLPEEKTRGLTIDLGFAYQEVEEGRVLGFVDVPGHEKFIRNMLAGVGAIDFALLVVAADDGPMPQTAEHLAILDLLGISKGALVLSKIYRVEGERQRAVQQQIRALAAETAFAGAPLFPVSAETGEGIPALRDHLAGTAREHRPAEAHGNFRLAVDRCFSLPGTGLVVTGSVFSGSVTRGDRLTLLPGGQAVRLRGLHAQNREAETGRMGQRCALNLAGESLRKSAIRRGDWLVAGDAGFTTRRLDVRLRVPTRGRPLDHLTTAHLHLAASDVTCRIALLEAQSIQPGGTARARLHADKPLGAVCGDRFILRDASARRTLAGGRVIDPLPPGRRRASPDRLAYLDGMELAAAEQALERCLEASPSGIDLAGFARRRNLTPAEAAALCQEVPMVESGAGAAHWGIAPAHWQALLAALEQALDCWHRERPERLGASAEALARLLPSATSASLTTAALLELLRQGKAARRGAVFHRPGHRASLPPADNNLWRRVEPALARGGLRPDTLGELVDSKRASRGRAASQFDRQASRRRCCALCGWRCSD